MALIQCPECGKSFSDKAVACPNCAYPLTDIDRIKLGIADPVAALEKGDIYYSEEKFKMAFDIYYAVSCRDNSEGLFKAGSMLCNGYGVDANTDKGIKLLQRAADKNYPDAIFFLGCLYDSSKEYDTALEYFRKSAELSDSFEESEYTHICYRLGCLLPDSEHEEKVRFLKKALQNGVANAEKELGSLYYRLGCNCVETDIIKAVSILEKAVKYNSEDSRVLLGKCYFTIAENEDDTEQKMMYLRKASSYGNEPARDELGRYYLLTGDNDISVLEKASDLGNKEAMQKLGAYYNEKGAQFYSGNGVNKSMMRAEQYFQRAVELGNESAEKNLSVLYNHVGVACYSGGESQPADYLKAEEYFEKAAELGNENAKENLGILYNQYGKQYQNGDRVRKNYDIAEEFFQKAADNGNEEARRNLVMVYVTCYFNYKHGINGYLRDTTKAKNYLRKAREKDPEILQEIADDYYSKALDMVKKGINHHNYKKINGYLKRASRLGKADLTEDLIVFYKAVSQCYKKGTSGFDKNKDRANHYMRKAAELGDEEALKKYKPTKKHNGLNVVVNAFETITGTSTTVLKKARNKGNYNYYYRDYND